MTIQQAQPFHNNEDVYRICRRCHEPDRLNKDNLCSDCVHTEKLQIFADNVAELVVSTPYDNKTMLQAVIESAQLLRRR
jgi:hypothetical protein